MESSLVAIQLGDGVGHLARSAPALVEEHFNWLVGLALRTPEPQGADRELLQHLIQQHPAAWSRCPFLQVVYESCPQGLRERKLLQALLRRAGNLQEEALQLGVMEHWITSPPRNLPAHLASTCFWLACLGRNQAYLEALGQPGGKLAAPPSEVFTVTGPAQAAFLRLAPGTFNLTELLAAQAQQGHLAHLNLLLRCLPGPGPATTAPVLRLLQAVPTGGLQVFFQVVGEPLALWATEQDILPALLRDFWWPLLASPMPPGSKPHITCLGALQAGWFPDPVTLQRLLALILPLPDPGRILHFGQDRWSLAFARLPWPPGSLVQLLQLLAPNPEADHDKLVCLLEALVAASSSPPSPQDLDTVIPALLVRRSERILSLLVELVADSPWLPRLSRPLCQAGFLQPLVRLWHRGGLDQEDRESLLEATHLALKTRQVDLWAFLQHQVLTEEELARDDLVEAVLGAALHDPAILARLRLTGGNLELVLITVLMAQRPELSQVLASKLHRLPPELMAQAQLLVTSPELRSRAQLLGLHLLPPRPPTNSN